MVDDLEEQSSEGLDLQHYLGVVRRRHIHFLIPLFLGWAICVGRELGASAAVPVEHADSGRAAHHAERLRHTERQR